MKKPTIKDVADYAGVSTATVDRVLNGRSGVSEKSRHKVKLAAYELGFGQISDRLLQSPKQDFRLKMIIPYPNTNFSEGLRVGMLQAPSIIEKFNVTADIKLVNPNIHSVLIEALDEIRPGEYHGVGIFAVDAPGVRQAINRAVDTGMKVITLVSDIPTSRRHYFIGIDNTAAGRAAGTLMGRFLCGRGGTIGVIAGSLSQRDHIDRLFGFEQIIRSRYPRLRILPVEEGASLRTRNATITKRLLEKHPDLCGIYSLAAGNAGIIEGLSECPRNPAPVVILHELSGLVRSALQDGKIDAVLAQDTGRIARSAVRVLTALCSGGNIVEAQEKMSIGIYLADNLP